MPHNNSYCLVVGGAECWKVVGAGVGLKGCTVGWVRGQVWGANGVGNNGTGKAGQEGEPRGGRKVYLQNAS